jgi:hypothetical protein
VAEAAARRRRQYSPGGSSRTSRRIRRDPDVFFAAASNGTWLEYTNRRTGQSREVHPYPRMFSREPSSALVERIQWTFPIIFSPVDPTFSTRPPSTSGRRRTTERIGRALGGDLTRHDPKTMGHSGGPITGDMNGPEVYARCSRWRRSKCDVNVIGRDRTTA